MKRWARWIPLFGTLEGYTQALFRRDLSAGLTTTVMLVPQAMAYSVLAGLDPVHGLYAALLPTTIYGLMGTARLALGPVALDSLIVGAGIAPIAGDDPVLYAACASVLMLMVGTIQFSMGIAGLGFIVKFLSRPVIAGFTSAAALIISTSQLKHVLGIKISRAPIFTTLRDLANHIDQTQWITLILAIATLVILAFLKRISRSIPRFLVVVAGGTIATWALGLHTHGVAIVGTVPSGLPSFQLPAIDMVPLGALLPIAITLAMVAFTEAVSIGQSFARQTGVPINANRELRAIGLSNITGSCTGAYPVTGSFSRSAINFQAGAETGISSLITSAMIALSLVALTPLFYYLPYAVLAAIIISAVSSLIEMTYAQHLWRVSRPDAMLMLITFCGTLFLGITWGIGAGVLSSLLWFVIANSKPHIAILGQIPKTTIFCGVERSPHASLTPGVLAIRIDAPLFFANIAFLSCMVSKLIEEQEEPIEHLVLDAAAIGSVDASGASALLELAEELERQKIMLWLATVRGPVRDALALIDVHSVIPPERMVEQVISAMNQIESLRRS